jgi:hypothetical protein
LQAEHRPVRDEEFQDQSLLWGEGRHIRRSHVGILIELRPMSTGIFCTRQNLRCILSLERRAATRRAGAFGRLFHSERSTVELMTDKRDPERVTQVSQTARRAVVANGGGTAGRAGHYSGHLAAYEAGASRVGKDRFRKYGCERSP